MTVRIPLSLLIVLLVTVSVYAQVPTMPRGWIETAEPTGAIENDSPLLCADYSRNVWHVELVSGQLHVTDVGDPKPKEAVFPPKFVRTKAMRGLALTLRVGNGWLIGFDDGEFGGGLWWANSDGSRTKLLIEDNVRFLISRDRDVLVLTGLSHMGFDHGTAYSFRANSEGGELNRIAELGSQPTDLELQDDGSALIAVSNGVVVLSGDGTVRRLYKQDDVGILYPHSIAGNPNELIFLGMRFYVVKLQRDPKGDYHATWFERSACRKTKIEGVQCTCTGEQTDN